jgi:hypothetical protein
MDLNLAHQQVKDNLAILIKEGLNKKWINKFAMPDLYKKA